MDWFKVTNTHKTNVGIGGQIVLPGGHKILTEERVDDGLRRLERRGLISIEEAKKPSTRIAKEKIKKAKKKKAVTAVVTPDIELPAKDFKEEPKKESAVVIPEQTIKTNTVDKIHQGPTGMPVMTEKAADDPMVTENEDYDKVSKAAEVETEEEEEVTPLTPREVEMGKLLEINLKDLRELGASFGIKSKRSKADTIEAILDRKEELGDL